MLILSNEQLRTLDDLKKSFTEAQEIIVKGSLPKNKTQQVFYLRSLDVSDYGYKKHNPVSIIFIACEHHCIIQVIDHICNI